ncbi:hypothetical protein ACFWPK_22360 [Nocardia sp. NPDC058519]|uniref:hypothetical protein n=1 Tax=Nocardia sp. NPDC058519 TaxID=3346535 RepID=UPI003655D65F
MRWKPSEAGERPTLGWAVLDWIEENLVVPDGPTAGEPLTFTREQAQFILKLYEIDPNFSGGAIVGRSMVNGRKVRRAVLSRPKGWGKSPLVAGLCLVEALGDVVMDGWDAAGQPVGRPWNSLGFKPKVQIVAVSEDQTANTWEPCLDMARNGPVYDNYDIDPMETFINVPRGRIEAVTSSGTSREGFRPVFSAMDQTESWTVSNGGRKLASTIRRNLAKVNGCSVETPNAPEPGVDSVAEKSMAAYRLQLEGRTKMPAGILVDHREAPADTDPSDEKSLRAGLAIAYGDSADVNGGWAPMDRIVADYWDPDTDPQEARRFYLNQITHSSDAWLSQPTWKACEDLDKQLQPGDTIVLGFDGSKGRVKGKADATALIGCRVSDAHLFEILVAEPSKEDGQDWAPNPLDFDHAVQQAFERYNVIGFYADPSGWVEWISKWEARYRNQLRVKATPANPIQVWPRGKDSKVELYVRNLEQAVLNREVTQYGPALTRHVLNARRRPTRTGYLLFKRSPDSPDKIDAAYAAVMAWKASLDAVSAGADEPKRTGKVW